MALGLYAPVKGIPLLTSGRNASGFEADHPPKFVLDNNMDTYWRPNTFVVSSVYVYVGVTTKPTTHAIALWIHNYNEDFTGKTFRVYSSTTDSGYTAVEAAQNIEDYRAAYSPVLLYPLPTATTDAYFYIEFDGFDAVPIGVVPEISGFWLLEDFALPHGHQKPVKNVNAFHNRNTVTRSGIRFNSHAGIGVQRSLERQFIHTANSAQWFNLRDAYRAAKGTLLPVFAQIEHDSTTYHAMHFARPLTDNETGYQYHVTTPVFRELGFKRIPYQDRSLFPLTDTVGLWRFKGDGTDESGVDNHFTVGGAYDADDFGRGFVDREAISAVNLQLGGGSAQFNIIPAEADDFSFGSGDFTIEMWHLMRSTVAGSDRFTLIKPGAWSMVNDNLFQVGMNLSDGINSGFWSNATPTADNKWHLHTAVVNRTADTLDFYVDGAFVKTRDISVITGTLTVTAGLYHQGLAQAGVIDTDEICITKRALTAAEILARYNGRTMYGDWGM